MNTKKKDDRLDIPIFLDYDVKEVFKNIRLEMIKELFEKDGFKETGETYGNFTVFRKKEKKSEKN